MSLLSYVWQFGLNKNEWMNEWMKLSIQKLYLHILSLMLCISYTKCNFVRYLETMFNISHLLWVGV
jgi:hypothetical protein